MDGFLRKGACPCKTLQRDHRGREERPSAYPKELRCGGRRMADPKLSGDEIRDCRDTAGVLQLLTFDELVELSEQRMPPAPLQQKLNALLTTPFVDNSTSNGGGLPIKPYVAGLGPSLRIVQWNIERGIELPAITAALSGAKAFEPFVDRSRYPEDDRRSRAIRKQANALRDADVIILNEVDWGLKRSGYHLVAKELAAALNMN